MADRARSARRPPAPAPRSSGPLASGVAVPALSVRRAEDGEEIEATLSALVDTALAPLDVTRHDRALARAMIDLNTWDALRGQEVGQAEAVTAIAAMLIARITTDGARA